MEIYLLSDTRTESEQAAGEASSTVAPYLKNAQLWSIYVHYNLYLPVELR